MLPALLFAVLSLQETRSPQEKVDVTVSGIVLDGGLKPLGGVNIGLLEQEDGDVAAALAKCLCTSGADGLFQVVVRCAKQGSWLAIGGPRWATQMRELTSELAPTLDLGGFAMAPGTMGSGRVRDPKGAPIAGALVIAEDLFDSNWWLQPGREGMQIHCRTLARSDASGFFRLPGMVRTAGRVLIRKEGCYDVALEGISAADPLDVTLWPSPTLRGHLVDESGRDVPALSVTVGGIETTTDANGRFAVSLRRRHSCSEGQVRAEATIDGRSCSAMGSLERSEEETKVVMQCYDCDPGPVEVSAVAPDGTRVTEFTAYAAWGWRNEFDCWPDAMVLAHVVESGPDWLASAKDGVAVLRGRGIVGYDGIVFVQAPGWAWARCKTDTAACGGKPLVVSLVREAVVHGCVIDAVSGNPLEGAYIVAIPRSQATGQLLPIGFEGGLRGPACARTDRDGRYELHGVVPCDNQVWVQVHGRLEPDPIAIAPVAGERCRVDFRSQPNRELRGSFGARMPLGSLVRAKWQGRRDLPNRTVPVQPDGSFQIADLHPGPWRVQLLCPSGPRGGHPLELQAGTWNGANAPDDIWSASAGQLATVIGKVGGPVPWERLGVTAVWRDGATRRGGPFHGPVTLLQPDRTFRLVVPSRDLHLILFDVPTCLPLEWQGLRTGPASAAEVTLAGNALEVVLNITAPRRVDDDGTLCGIQYAPEACDWPYGIGDFPDKEGSHPRERIRNTRCAVGRSLSLWVRSHTGTLHFSTSMVVEQSLDLASVAPGPIKVEVR